MSKNTLLNKSWSIELNNYGHSGRANHGALRWNRGPSFNGSLYQMVKHTQILKRDLMDAFGSNAFLITKVFNLTRVCPLFDIKICFKNCFDHVWEKKNLLVIERKFCKKTKDFQKIESLGFLLNSTKHILNHTKNIHRYCKTFFSHMFLNFNI